MPPTPEQAELGYHRMWDRCAVETGKVEAAKKIAGKIAAGREAYERIEQATSVPWFMTGAIHSRESDLNFKTHLHNGDPLTARTRHVPAGRPKTGSPPFEFTASAIDALTMAPHQLQKVSVWSTERVLYELEKYNGWGYLHKGNSPYLWAWTSEYHGGKYVRDGIYDPRAWDSQAGCVALFKELAVLEPDVAARLAQRQATPSKDVNEAATRRERAARAAGVAGAGAGGASEAGKSATKLDSYVEQPQPQSPFLPPVIAWPLIGIGIAVVIVATVLIARKKAAILAKWSGSGSTV